MLLFPGESVFVDLIAYVHLLFVAIGFGLAIRLDFLFFQKRWSNVSKVMLADTLQSHHMIMFAMVGLWEDLYRFVAEHQRSRNLNLRYASNGTVPGSPASCLTDQV
jgi:hypothetical protein